MRIAVLTDTHVGSVEELPGRMLASLREVDLIVHAGDFTETSVLEGLALLKPVKAVCGNMDSRGLRNVLPRKDEFVIAGKRIGLTHGSGAPFGMAGRVRAQFEETDVIIFGHSHVACHQRIRGALMFNPGACVTSYGLLTIADDIKAEIIRV